MAKDIGPSPNWATIADARPDVVALALVAAPPLLRDAFPNVNFDEVARTKGPVTALVYYLGVVAEGRAPAYPDPNTASNIEAARTAEFVLSELQRKVQGSAPARLTQ